MSAEMIRDNALRVSGLLSEKMGGPPVYPPQPDGLWRQTGRNEPKYLAAKNEDRFRRGVSRDLEKGRPLCKFREFRRARPFVLFPQEEPDQHPFAGVDSSQ